MILDDIIEKRKEQLCCEKSKISYNDVKAKAMLQKKEGGRFYKALLKGRLSVIAEVKKASPSKGLIKADFNHVEIAKAYENAGVDAISVLTEEFYFKGSVDYLKQIRESVNIPILCKDFIIDEYQIYQAATIGADAILLIVAILDIETLKAYSILAQSIGLDCLVEVHDECELQIALYCGAEIIGINNRNLKTFEVDLDTTKRLLKLIPNGHLIVSESGITTNEDLRKLKGNGVGAVLIGETLMRSDNLAKTLSSLRSGV
jgi:indole-3-glycerol phosphate synthase